MFISIVIVWYCYQTLCVDTLSIKIKGNTSGLLGENGTEIECSYTKENVRTILRVDIMAFNKSRVAYELIAGYLPDQVSQLLLLGQYLKGRVTLTSITQVSTKTVMIFNKLMCIDDTFYKCRITYLDDSFDILRDTSSNTSIQIQVTPSKPDFLSWNMLLTATQDITGEHIAFVCSGNVGRPPGKFIIQKYRRGHSLPINYTATETSIQEISDDCSYYRTSNVTLQVSAEDNQAVIRCAVVSPLADGNVYVDSDPLNVNFAVEMPTIVKHPNKTDYVVGVDTSISLNCTTNGNPKPTYLWYKDNQIEAISTSKTLTITNVTTTNSGIYICIVSNIFNDVIHTKRVQMHVCITKEGIKTPVMKQPNSENTAVIVVGAVCGLIILVLCVLLFGVIQNRNNFLPVICLCRILKRLASSILSSIHNQAWGYGNLMPSCLLVRNRNDISLDYVNTTQHQIPSLYEGVDNRLDVHNYEQLAIARREDLYNNAN